MQVKTAAEEYSKRVKTGNIVNTRRTQRRAEDALSEGKHGM